MADVARPRAAPGDDLIGSPPGAEPARDDEPPSSEGAPPDGGPSGAWLERAFGSRPFFKLWLAQVVSSLGDWIGFVAVTAIAARVGGQSPGAAVGFVLSARLIPGFFFGSAAGVLVDRWDRKKVMVVCDIGRGLTLATLPFVHTVPALFVASLLLEVFTLLWSPAKEASVPHLVPPSFLANANSLSLVAAYGTFPIGAGIFAALAGVARWLGGYDALDFLRVSQENLAVWFDVATFFLSAATISTLAIESPRRSKGHGSSDLNHTLDEFKEGWRFIGQNRRVRAVIVGLATGLIGGGMVVPLGPIFSRDVLGAGTAGFGLLLTGLGVGVAAGIVALSVLQKRLPHERVFVTAVFVAGGSLMAGASTYRLALAMVCVAVLGVCAGAVYVLGFTILQTTVEDELRGRIFATLYTVVRLCLLLAFTLAPLVSSLLENTLDGRDLHLGAVTVALPGVRLTLWLGGLIILLAGFLALRSLRPVTAERR